MEFSQEHLAPESLTRLETENRLLFSLIRPVVRFARRCRVPLDRLTELVTLVYFKDLRSAGLTVDESAKILGKSVRTVIAISQRTKDDFFAPEEEHGLARRIEFLLSERPRSFSELLEALGPQALEGRTAIEHALELLIAEERVTAHADAGTSRYHTTSNYANLTRNDWARRIDALNHLSEAVLDTVITRLQQNDDNAFARVFTFAAPLDALQKLRTKLYDLIRLGTSDLEAAAARADISDEKYHLVFCVSPTVEDTDLTPSGQARRSRQRRPKPTEK